MQENPQAKDQKTERDSLLELGADLTKSEKGKIYTLTLIFKMRNL